MALRAVTEHPKFFDLKSILSVGKLVAVGALETMWHFCGKFTPQGDIGKYSVRQIEAWCEWEGSSGSLVDALVESGWIDRHPTYGLVVHDWHKHCDDATKLAVKRAGVDFVTYRHTDGTYPVVQGKNPVKTPSSSGQSDDAVATPLPRPPDGVPTVSGLPGAEPEPVPGAEPVPDACAWRSRIDGQWVALGSFVDSLPVVDSIEGFEAHRSRIGEGGYPLSKIQALAAVVDSAKPSEAELAEFVRHCFAAKGWKTLPPDALPKWLTERRRSPSFPGVNPGAKRKPRSQWTAEETAAHEAELAAAEELARR